ncbi:MAG: hypothetical protein ACU0BF_02135 [Paracoccaceae bacterium]
MDTVPPADYRGGMLTRHRRAAARWLRPNERALATELWARLCRAWPEQTEIVSRRADFYGIERLAFPITANHKFLWRRFVDHHPVWRDLSSKVDVKLWAADQGISTVFPQTLWVGTDPDALPDALLVPGHIVKLDRAFGSRHFVQRGTAVEIDRIRQKARAWLARRPGHAGLQWGYFTDQPRILIETVYAPPEELEEFKVYTFGADASRVLRIAGREVQTKGVRLDRMPDGRFAQMEELPEVASAPLTTPTPGGWDEMMAVASKIGARFDHLRVDFMTAPGRPFVLNELTVYNLAGKYPQGGRDPGSLGSRLWDIRRSPTMQAPPADDFMAEYLAALSRFTARVRRSYGD